jgi:predicted Rossmann fold nucleotide-binding protein DprA/Smf involved in DNA uptake
MNVSSQAQAVILLTVPFGKADAKPLSIREWGRFAAWLKDQELDPSQLLTGNPKSLLLSWMDKAVTVDRIEGLLDRGGALGLALEKWQRAGLWIVTRSEGDYPERLKRRLRLDSPPVFFGCGNKALLNKGGIAIVGSRDADEEDLKFSTILARSAAHQGLSVVSGGARGVDENAMLSALENKGAAVGVMADDLLRAATSAKYRKHLLSGDLVLVSPFNPEAGFNVGNAMARN